MVEPWVELSKTESEGSIPFENDLQNSATFEERHHQQYLQVQNILDDWLMLVQMSLLPTLEWMPTRIWTRASELNRTQRPGASDADLAHSFVTLSTALNVSEARACRKFLINELINKLRRICAEIDVILTDPGMDEAAVASESQRMLKEVRYTNERIW
jgi:hypothetical protein